MSTCESGSRQRKAVVVRSSAGVPTAVSGMVLVTD